MDDTFDYWYEHSKTLKTEDYNHRSFNVRTMSGGGLPQMGAFLYDEFVKDYTGNLKSILSGSIYTIKDGLVHCDGEPSFYSDSYVSFYEDGVVHRRDGPATIFKSGDLEWALYGEYFEDFKEYLENNTYIDDEEKLLLVMKYG